MDILLINQIQCAFKRCNEGSQVQLSEAESTRLAILPTPIVLSFLYLKTKEAKLEKSLVSLVLNCSFFWSLAVSDIIIRFQVFLLPKVRRGMYTQRLIDGKVGNPFIQAAAFL